MIHSLLSRQFLKFLIVGGINTGFGYSIFMLAILLGMHYTLAMLTANVLGVLFNFNTTGRLVFANRNPRLIFNFVGVYAIVYVTQITLLHMFHLLGTDMKIAGALVIFPVAVLSFLLQKTFVFRNVPVIEGEPELVAD